MKYVKNEVIKEIISSCDNHIKIYGFKQMSIDEFNELTNTI